MGAALWVWFVGNVWPNLVASGICTAIVWWRARIHLRRHHDRIEAAHRRRHGELCALLAAPDDPSPTGDAP